MPIIDVVLHEAVHDAVMLPPCHSGLFLTFWMSQTCILRTLIFQPRDNWFVGSSLIYHMPTSTQHSFFQKLKQHQDFNIEKTLGLQSQISVVFCSDDIVPTLKKC